MGMDEILGAENPDAVRDFVDAANVKGQFLYRKDGLIGTYLKIYFFNIDLLSDAQRKALTDNLVAQFKNDKKRFTYFSLPREVDMDKYKQNLKDKYQNQRDLGKRQLLNIMMTQSLHLIMGGENFEHQHFIRIWEPSTLATRKNAEEKLGDRISEFEKRYKSVGINCEILQEPDIVKLCNLFGNSLQASSESVGETTLFSPILQL